MQPWMCFAREGQYWCVRSWDRGHEVWYGMLGKRGQVVAKVTQPQAMDTAIEKKLAAGYLPIRSLAASNPKPKQVTAARQRAVKAVDPRYRGHYKVRAALDSGDAERLRQVFERGQADASVMDPWFATDQDLPFLLNAAGSSEPKMLRLFLDHGAPLNGYEGTGTPLQEAITEGRIENVRMLLAAGADPNGRPPHLPLALALYMGRQAAARLLLECGADVNATTPTGETALLNAVRNGMGNLPAVRILLEAGADPNLANDEGRTPLGHCRSAGRSGRGAYAEIEALLVAAGARAPSLSPMAEELESLLSKLDLPMNSRSALRSLSDAAAQGDTDAVRMFLADGDDPDSDYRNGWYPMQRAAHFGHDEVLTLLRQAGAQERPPLKPTWNPLGEQLHTAVAMIAMGIPGYGMDGPEPERLHDEQREQATARCSALIRDGALGDEGGKFKIFERPVLGYAAENGLWPVVQALLEVGCDPDGEGEERTPLAEAAMKGFTRCVRTLLAAGANPEGREGHMTPLSFALGRGDLKLVRALVEGGAFLRTDNTGMAPCAVVEGPEQNAIRRYLRQRLRPKIEHSRRRSVRFVAHKKMFDEPRLLRGHDDHSAWRPDRRLGLVQAPLDQIAEALSSSYEYNCDVAETPLLAVQEGAFLIQQRGSEWSVLACIGLSNPRAEAVMREFAERLGRDTALMRYWPTRFDVFGPHARELCSDRRIETFFEEQALWVPPYCVQGDGHWGGGLENRLLFRGVRPEHIVRVDRVVLIP